MLFRSRALILGALGFAACGGAPPREPEAEPPPAPAVEPPKLMSRWIPEDAAVGVKSPELRTLLEEHWAFNMQESPVWATRLGIHRFDAELSDRSEGNIAERRKKTQDFLGRANAVSEAGLSEGDAVTLRLLRQELTGDVRSDVCEYELWSLSPRNNPVTEWNQLHENHQVESVEDGRNLVARYRLIANVIDQDVSNLKRGVKRGLFANAESTRRVVVMLEKQLAQPFAEWPLLTPTKKAHASWPAGELETFRKEIEAAVAERVKPALERYLAVVRGEILPKARGPEAEGIGALPHGKQCYAAEIQQHTTLDKSAEELHELGKKEGARIDATMLELGKKLFGKKTLADVLRTLRTDPKLYFANEAEIVQKAEASLARAKQKMPAWFGVLPKADCVVRRIPDYEAPYTTIAYYKQPDADGTKPGEYFINVFEPNKRPRFEAEVLAVHESIPGHHLQIAIAQERGELPAFRKHGGATSFVEDRKQAEDYMLAHTALTELNVKNEVDRYITWPGQALAYKVGQLEIIALRAKAEKALGTKFRLPKFHDALLAGGAVSLPELRLQIDRFIRESQG